MDDQENLWGSYYIRSRGRVQGPFNLTQLQQLRARGQFSRVHEVSGDQNNWQPASNVEHLFANPSRRSARASEADFSEPETGVASNSITFPAGEWYYALDGERCGPITTNDMEELVLNRQLLEDDLVWKETLTDWKPIRDIAELSGLVPPKHSSKVASAQSLQTVATNNFCFACGAATDARAEICPHCGVRLRHAQTQKSRTTAALLALLLGGTGAHHFYLGNPALGVLYLLFIWTLVPAIAALIEGLMYLSMSDAAFAARYDRH